MLTPKRGGLRTKTVVHHRLSKFLEITRFLRPNKVKRIVK